MYYATNLVLGMYLSLLTFVIQPNPSRVGEHTIYYQINVKQNQFFYILTISKIEVYFKKRKRKGITITSHCMDK